MPASEKAKKTDLFRPDGENDFWVRSRSQVLAVLSRLKNRTTPVTAYFNGDQSYIITVVLGLLKERDLLILDEGPSDKLNVKLLRSGQACCVAMQDNIRIRFDCANLKRARYKGCGVFVCPIPGELLYLQRRECYRVAVSVLNPPVCFVPQRKQDPLELLVVDISVGGVSLHNLNQPVRAKPQDLPLYRGCRLFLPDFGELTVDLKLQSIRRAVRKDGTEVQKIGARFVNLRPGASNHIQRYVHKIQLKQMAISRK